MNENDYIYLLLAFILGYFANSIIKQMCGQNVEGITDKISVYSEDYSCGESPKDYCEDCGYPASYYWEGGCFGEKGGMSAKQQKDKRLSNGYGPVIPLQELPHNACNGGKCGVWCDQKYKSGVKSGVRKKCKARWN